MPSAAVAARSKVRTSPSHSCAGAGVIRTFASISSGATACRTGPLRAWGEPDHAKALPRASSSNHERSRVASPSVVSRVRATRANAVPAAA